MRILLCVENADLRQLLSFRLSSEFPVSVQEVPSVEEITALITVEEIDTKSEPIDLLITPLVEEDSVFLQHLRQRQEPIPQIFYYEKAAPKKEQLKGLLVLGSLEKANLVEKVLTLVKEFVAGANEEGIDLEYSPIRTTLLIRATPLKSDIYIRLSSKKYLKLFHAGTDFTTEDLEKYYHAKKVEYMFLRRKETSEFLVMFTKELDDIVKSMNAKGEDLFATVTATQEIVENLVQRVGFSEDVQILAKKNIELTLLSVAETPKLNDLFEKLKKDTNYLSQHSALIAHLSCCIAQEMDWVAENTLKKLILASYMHDITLQNPAIAKLRTIAEVQANQKQFDPKEVEAFLVHPARASELVKSFQEIPADVDQIVLQHHERPNGSGFPGKLIFSYISPLSTAFIIAHDLTQAMISQDVVFSLSDFITQAKKEYYQGNFKKIMSALEQLVH